MTEKAKIKPKAKALPKRKEPVGKPDKPLKSAQLNKEKALDGKIPNTISRFVAFNPKKIENVNTYRAAEITMLLATDKKGIFRPTKLLKNFDSQNVTYKALKQFLCSPACEKIWQKIPVDGKYVCVDYATELHNLSEKSGIRCGVVDVLYKHGDGHALNVFQTTDKGLIFVDFALLGNYTLSGFLGKKRLSERTTATTSEANKDQFFSAVQVHYMTPSGKRKKNIEKVTITW
jgi:hypothetical protein